MHQLKFEYNEELLHEKKYQKKFFSVNGTLLVYKKMFAFTKDAFENNQIISGSRIINVTLEN